MQQHSFTKFKVLTRVRARKSILCCLFCCSWCFFKRNIRACCLSELRKKRTKHWCGMDPYLPGLWIKVRLEVTLFSEKPPCFSCVNDALLMLISSNLHKKSEDVIKTWSTPASLFFKGQATKHRAVKLFISTCVFTDIPRQSSAFQPLEFHQFSVFIGISQMNGNWILILEEWKECFRS